MHESIAPPFSLTESPTTSTPGSFTTKQSVASASGGVTLLTAVQLEQPGARNALVITNLAKLQENHLRRVLIAHVSHRDAMALSSPEEIDRDTRIRISSDESSQQATPMHTHRYVKGVRTSICSKSSDEALLRTVSLVIQENLLLQDRPFVIGTTGASDEPPRSTSADWEPTIQTANMLRVFI